MRRYLLTEINRQAAVPLVLLNNVLLYCSDVPLGELDRINTGIIEFPTGGNNCESQTFSEAHLRQMQGYQAQGSRYGYLRKAQAQTKTRLGFAVRGSTSKVKTNSDY
jgi:hypothetical protein